MEYLIILVPIVAIAMILGFWKKPKLLLTTPAILVVLLLIGFLLHPSPCSSSPAASAVFAIMGIIIIATLVASFTFILAGVYLWTRYSKIVIKKNKATQLIKAGIITIVCIIVVTIMINVVISALGLGNLMCLNIPALKDIQTN